MIYQHRSSLTLVKHDLSTETKSKGARGSNITRCLQYAKRYQSKWMTHNRQHHSGWEQHRLTVAIVTQN